MTQEMIMPKLGLTMTHGKITRWLKQEGEQVKAGEAVVEIETDKINSDVESPADGYIIKILAQEGDEKEITVPICIIGELKDLEAPQGGKQEANSKAIAGARIFITPFARKIAAENGIDVSNIKGTGSEGRIVREDIFAVIEESNKPKPAIVVPEAETVNTHNDVMPGERRVPLVGMRKVIAQRLSQSKHDIPHVYFKADMDATKVIELKRKVSELVRAKTGKKLSINELIIKVAATALAEFPDINVSLVDNEIIYHENINIGMAVSVEKGLVVPVIKNADKMGLPEINRTVRELVGKAREGKLKLDETSEGTFTVSNLGTYGIDEFSAIINPPESAILAVGASKEVPCVENGQIVAKSKIAMTLSVDHRVIDGALAAQFMKRLKELLEEPCLLYEGENL